MPSPAEAATRIDKWLWAARFFRTRSLAAEAVNGGKVHLNGVRVKPARMVRVGDRLEIVREGERYVVDIRMISERRGPAAQAVSLYEEDEQVRSVREAEALQKRYESAGVKSPSHRPGKRDRRRIRQLRGLE